MKKFLKWFLSLDRRIIYALLAIAVIVPILIPLNVRVYPTPEVTGVFDTIENLPEGSNIMLSVDYDPASMPELYPMMKAIMQHVINKRHKLFILALWPLGTGLVTQAISELKEVPGNEWWTEGEDYVFLGYKPGTTLVIMGVGQSIRDTFVKDYTGKPLDTMPIMQGVDKLKQMDYLVMLEAGIAGDYWIVYGTEVHDVPVGAGVTAVMAPQYYPYLQANQVNGIIGGLKGAAEYEALMDFKGKASRAMDAQATVHSLVFLAIILANVFTVWLRALERKERAGGVG